MAENTTATGRSDVLSFDEAFRDAVSKLPEREHPMPDALLHVKVTDIRGEFGGFDGRTRLLVTITAHGL